MTENMKIAMVAINKWLYFGWNYGLSPYTVSNGTGKNKTMYLPDFLMQAKWNCNINHMIDKWKSATSSENPDAFLVRFYAELDKENRMALLEWVMENYNREAKIINETI